MQVLAQAMNPCGANVPARFEFVGGRNCGFPNVTVLRIAQGERIIKQPSAIARQTQNQRTYFPCRKNIPLNTMAAAMSNIGASGRKRVPTPTINPAPSAVYSALRRGGRWVLFKRKSCSGTLLKAITRAQQASAVQKVAKTSVSGTAA